MTLFDAKGRLAIRLLVLALIGGAAGSLSPAAAQVAENALDKVVQPAGVKDPLLSGKPAGDDDVARAIRASEKLDGDARAIKSGRLAAPGTEDDVPMLASPVDAAIAANPATAAEVKPVKPSEGTALLDRMGLPLPDLPPEKPFKGVVDEAYGAFQRGLYLEAMDKALARAQKGDASAQTLVAEMLASGLGVKRNLADAVFWYEQGAKGGDANAQYRYALLLMDGSLVKADKKRAAEMMQKAADGGNKYAQFNIAQIKVAAKPGPEGLTEALPWYEKAARQGVPDAQYAMSQLLMALDLPKDKRAEARTWLEKAAKAGFDTAQYDMAVWMINGINGERDFDAGFKWMLTAARNGLVVAQNKVAHLYINGIGTTPDAIEAAKWYVLSRRAGLKDLELEDFYLGINDSEQQEAIARADRFARG